jgi:hypothetical protein
VPECAREICRQRVRWRCRDCGLVLRFWFACRQRVWQLLSREQIRFYRWTVAIAHMLMMPNLAVGSNRETRLDKPPLRVRGQCWLQGVHADQRARAPAFHRQPGPEDRGQRPHQKWQSASIIRDIVLKWVRSGRAGGQLYMHQTQHHRYLKVRQCLRKSPGKRLLPKQKRSSTRVSLWVLSFPLGRRFTAPSVCGGMAVGQVINSEADVIQWRLPDLIAENPRGCARG